MDSYSGSPQWSASSKRLVLTALAVLVLLAIYRVRALLLPFIMAVVLAYLVEPVIKWITQRTRLPRTLVIVIVYLLIILALVSGSVSVISPVANQVGNFLIRLPQYQQQVAGFLEEPIFVSGREINLDHPIVEQAFTSLAENILTIAQGVGRQSLIALSSVATATISTVGWTILVLFLSFYLVKDHDTLFRSVVNLVPAEYQADVYHLANDISDTWHAFLRGQLVLCLVVGTIIFALALIIDLPNALLLAIIGGLAEFLPTFGPVIAAIPAGTIALFQSEASWIGTNMSPFWFAVLVLGLYAIIYQLENYYLVPRIIGRHLKLHPLVVILGALAGASVAGLLGILLAAPVLATARLVFRYLYSKLTDSLPFPTSIKGEFRVLSEEEE